ncbi:hypothetical protein ES288_D07G211500v1 [Gossypium darwinii]|uniref:Endonuclease/exonuclease/phosphatase domain-containing protein n=1 Tax=Gossypium darwinii TaxID=34276 RepID=A0A5D2BY26_GOSDA|nr:hypothetical protein ES288_D07G211500v1 [Gossypium darwinii]
MSHSYLSGDFNVIMGVDERQGGAVTGKVWCSRFRYFFFNHGFIDLGVQGPKFTWSKGRLFQRLDRSFCNGDWQSYAPNTTVRHLYKLKSDHRPLLVSTNPERIEKGVRPFCFLASWLSHPEFQDVISKAWISDNVIMQNLENFSKSVQVWNRTVFVNIFDRKRTKLKELKQVQRALERRFSSKLSLRETKT